MLLKNPRFRGYRPFLSKLLRPCPGKANRQLLLMRHQMHSARHAALTVTVCRWLPRSRQRLPKLSTDRESDSGYTEGATGYATFNTLQIIFYSCFFQSEQLGQTNMVTRTKVRKT